MIEKRHPKLLSKIDLEITYLVLFRRINWPPKQVGKGTDEIYKSQETYEIEGLNSDRDEKVNKKSDRGDYREQF